MTSLATLKNWAQRLNPFWKSFSQNGVHIALVSRGWYCFWVSETIEVILANPFLRFINFPGFCFLVSMGHGIKYLNITTNPVELWASPSSRARVEREFFDSKFNPFYRIEQVRLVTFC